MDKEKFLAVLKDIVAGFEKPEFKSGMAAAMAAKDVQKLIALPMGLQTEVFQRHGLDSAAGPAQFKEAGKLYGAAPEVVPLLARMMAALGK